MSMFRTRSALFAAFAVVTTATLVSLPAAAEEKKERASKDDYELDLSASSKTVGVGENGTFSLVIRAKNKTKIHPQAPLTVKLSATEGVTLAKAKLSREDAKKEEGAKDPDLRTQLTGVKEGEHKVTAEISFFLCTEAWCQRMNDKVELAVNVGSKPNG
jgi:hypothetical protein